MTDDFKDIYRFFKKLKEEDYTFNKIIYNDDWYIAVDMFNELKTNYLKYDNRTLDEYNEIYNLLERKIKKLTK